MPTQILIVDDEPSVTDLLAYNLHKVHYEVLVAADGRQALQLAREKHPDLILLDLMLPEVDGWDVCRELRKASSVPIIMITARGEEIDRVVGLELGADDYVCKPFSMRELLARIKAILRRAPIPAPVSIQSTAQEERTQQELLAPNTRPLSAAESRQLPSSSLRQDTEAEVLTGPGGLRLDVERRQVTAGGQTLDLTRLEFDLLHLLLANAGRVLTRPRLLEQAWGYDFAGDTRAVDSAIKRLRAKLRAAALDADTIEAVRGVGYRLVP